MDAQGPERFTGLFGHRRCDQHRLAERLAKVLHAACDIDGGRDRGEIEPVRAADVAENDGAEVNADAGRQRLQPVAPAPDVEGAERIRRVGRRFERIPAPVRMRVAAIDGKQGKNAVADELQDVPAMGMDGLHDGFEIAVQGAQQRRVAPSLRLGGKVAQIGKHDDGIEGQVLAAPDRPLDHRLCRTLAEIGPQQAFGRTPHGHRLESRGQGVAGIGDQVDMRRRKPAGVGGHETAALRRAVAIFQRHGEKVRPAGRGKLVVGDVVPVRVQPDQALVQHRAVSHDLLERAAEPGSRFQDFPRDGVFGGFLRRPDDAPGGEQRIGQALGEARAGQRHPGCG